jgi:hypothetical protein
MSRTTIINERAEIFANRTVTELLIRYLAQSDPHIIAGLRSILQSRAPALRPEAEEVAMLMPGTGTILQRVSEILFDAERGPK